MSLLPVEPIQRPGTYVSSVISSEKLKQLYTLMARSRAYKLKVNKARTAKRGQIFSDACEVAAIVNLQSEDLVMTLPGQKIALVSRKESLAGPRDQDASATLCIAVENGSKDRLAIAAGLALAHRIQRTNKIVIAFAAPGDIARASDAVRLAQEQKLAIIYIEQTDASVRKSNPTVHQLPTLPVDDSDAVAAYRVAYESIDKARRGAGPTLIQCVRHQSVSTRHRARDERADPIVYMEHYLRQRNLWSDDLRF